MERQQLSLATICAYGNSLILVFLALYFLLIPLGVVVLDLTDPALREGGMPRCALRVHRSLSPRYEKWARRRVASGRATKLSTGDVAGTEWPVFGSVFYLWATESLQEAWEEEHTLSRLPPREYARGAIEAAAALVADPSHAAWVKRHWGDDYLHQENLFYRALLIAGLTSHRKLLGSDRYLPLLTDQVETLSKELDESPYGLLNDYPGECYPTDVLGAIAAIRRADAVLGTDHAGFVRRAIRGFEGTLLDSTGLPPFMAEPLHGTTCTRARGCGVSFMLIWAPELWPSTAREWYTRYDEHFWQTRWTGSSFREMPRDMPGHNWYFDIDAGPVLAGHGIAAGAFGIGAARANGRFDHAYALCAQALVASCPLLDGTLLGPRMLSDASDAPYLGEAGLLFSLTRMPVNGTVLKKGEHLPLFVYWVLSLYLALGLLFLAGGVRPIWRRWRQPTTVPAPGSAIHSWLWLALVTTAIVVSLTCRPMLGMLCLLLALVVPRVEKGCRNRSDAAQHTNGRPADGETAEEAEGDPPSGCVDAPTERR